MSSLKSVARELREFAVGLADSRGVQSEELTSRQDALLLLALSALKELETSGSPADLAQAAKSARRLLRVFLPHPVVEKGQSLEYEQQDSERPSRKRERESKDDTGKAEKEESDNVSVDLGQYAKAHVFDDNAKKRDKFARLMGGRRNEGSHHNTFAPDKTTIKRINGELEEQFNNALVRSGRKGLGA
ncbi:hypothetical protein, conserved [Trypanosoma brucei gambiense DAL972]|uniref:Small acidic protein n=1 Tax=Trypanosoma brucei gambiense (strain MHOM/CI/86/DAL972) TaxID=679716 RepID=D0A8J9_TRYB9|nr:hypothetical protein, conserved [Trypanosoma brucei gambiense DAL972]CBH18000.1 hypothetical protein, conserved [Trypanosoma brucei gambiense DAL972]|eukprot:XP_011780264.1 hypothetical protein, conserved [Trypanosoma brucei gambiense DAL972]